MPVEIRELIIKTEVRSMDQFSDRAEEEQLKRLKYEVMEECRRMIQHSRNRKSLKR